jgi:hypothetical protein
MTEAIKLAIEKGGYDPHKYGKTVKELREYPDIGFVVEYEDGYKISSGFPIANIQVVTVLDPLFWQALGKALGWIDYARPQWLQYALEYFELALTSGDTEKFWKELLN